MTAFKISKSSLQENRGGKKSNIVFTHLYYFYSSFPGKEKKKGMVNVGNMGEM